MSWHRWDGDDLLLSLHVQPGASRPGIAGLHGDAVKIRVSAAPQDGRANREVVRLLADAFAVAPSAVRLLRGATGRRKRVRVARPGKGPARSVLDKIDPNG